MGILFRRFGSAAMLIRTGGVGARWRLWRTRRFLGCVVGTAHAGGAAAAPPQWGQMWSLGRTMRPGPLGCGAVSLPLIRRAGGVGTRSDRALSGESASR